MGVVTGLLIFLLILAVLVYLAARRSMERIRDNPDPYPLSELMKPPTGEKVEIRRPDGTVLHAVSEGSGPTVVLVHGFAISMFEWNILWAKLRGTHRLIAYDHRGHGSSTIGSEGISSSSMAADLVAVLEHFDVQDGVLVGHSMGGFISIVALLEQAERIQPRLRHAVIMASFAGDVGNGSPQNRLQIPLIQWGILPAIVGNPVLGGAFGISLFGTQPAPSQVETFRWDFARQRHSSLVPILKAFLHENHYPRLGEIAVPCTIVCGEQDNTTPPQHSEWLTKGVKNGRFIRIPQVGHVLNWEAPDRIIEVIRSV